MQCITFYYMRELSHQLVARIPRELNKRLRQRARAARRRSSEIVRLALEAYLGAPEDRVRDRIDHLVGALTGGPSDLSTNRKHLLQSFRDRR